MRWGLIGTRGLVVKGCLPAFAEARNADLVAVLSSDRGRAEAFAGEHGLQLETATSDIDDFLATPELEAVWICSPTFRHHEQAGAALEAGKHVLLEKPLAMTSADGWDLVERAKAAGRLLATGYQGRYVPGHQEMRRLIDEGAIGQVSVAQTYYGIKRPGPPPEWRQRRDTARWGALADVGTHHVDLIRMLLGEITEAKALSANQQGFETDDVDAAALTLESGALVSLGISTNAWKQHTRVAIHGTEAALVAVDTNPQGQGTVHLIRRDGEQEDVTGDTPMAWTAQLEAVTRVASGDDLPYATGEDGARNLEILEQILA
jgi:1,5-anhydro-D-fructose reductase (1,5-anhydro-D-mannitol-forming)